jgi:hypothetical protein
MESTKIDGGNLQIRIKIHATLSVVFVLYISPRRNEHSTEKVAHNPLTSSTRTIEETFVSAKDATV